MFAMLFVLIALFGVASVVGLVGFMLGRRQLPRSAAAPPDHRLAEQVKLLEEELQRVKDQADFTERMLTERGSTSSENVIGGNPEG